MVIINPTSIIQPAAVNRPAGPAPVLPTDKVLMAQVMGQRAKHLYELASGNLRLMAESKTPLRTGEQLLLQHRGVDPQNRPILQVMGKPSAALAPILREILPKQQAINHLVASVSHAHRQGDSPTLNKIVQEFISQLPNRSQFSQPEALKTILQNSGLFFEHSLKSGTSSTNDLKSALLRLASQLQALSTSTSSPQAAKSSQQTRLSSEYGGGKVSTTATPQLINAEQKLPAQNGITSRPLFNPLPKTHPAIPAIAEQATKSAIFSRPAGTPAPTQNVNQQTLGTNTAPKTAGLPSNAATGQGPAGNTPAAVNNLIPPAPLKSSGIVLPENATPKAVPTASNLTTAANTTTPPQTAQNNATQNQTPQPQAGSTLAQPQASTVVPTSAAQTPLATQTPTAAQTPAPATPQTSAQTPVPAAPQTSAQTVATSQAAPTQAATTQSPTSTAPAPPDLRQASTTIEPKQPTSATANQLSMAAKSAYSAATHHSVNLPGQAAAQARLELGSGMQFTRGEQLASQLLQETKGALFRQEAHQLLHLQQREAQPHQYMMEIPVRERDGIDVWQLQLSTDPRDDESEQQEHSDADADADAVKGWKIVLNFDLPGLGAMSANIRDHDGHLDINIRSKMPQTDSLVKRHQAELLEKLAQQGVSDVDIKSHCGEAEEQDSPLQYYNLLSTKA